MGGQFTCLYTNSYQSISWEITYVFLYTYNGSISVDIWVFKIRAEVYLTSRRCCQKNLLWSVHKESIQMRVEVWILVHFNCYNTNGPFAFDQICPKIATFRPQFTLTPKSPKTVGHSPLTKTELTLNTSDTSNISHCTPCHLLWNSSKSASFKSLYIFSCTAKSSDAVSLTLWMNSSRPPAE